MRRCFFMSYRQTQQKESSFAFQIVKGSVLAVLLSLALALIFALVLLLFSLPDSVILPINQTLKVLAIALAVLLSVRDEKGWIKGAIIGFIATMLTTFAFSFLGGGLSLSWLIFAELAYCGAAGAVMGMLSANLFK